MFLKDFKEEEIAPKKEEQQLDVNRYFVPTQTINVQNVSQFNLPGLKLDGHFSEPAYLCTCMYIEELTQLKLLDELLILDQGDIVGITVQMNADVLNEQY